MMSTATTQKCLLFAGLGLVSALSDGSEEFYRLLYVPADADNSTAKLVLLEQYVQTTGARCLDGTPGAYYLRPGTGSGVNKWYIHHQGGGWCESMDDCLGRSKGGLGSSSSYGPTSNLKGGYFDPSPSVNPMMYNWNTVMMQYCDGGSFSGNNETVTTYQGTPLYFRGKRVREAVYDSLIATASLANATDVVISGCSAGGLATFLHTDQWCDALAVMAPGVKCVGMPDSGFFLDYQDPRVAKSLAQQPAQPGVAGTPLPGLANTPGGTYHSGLRWVFSQMNSSAGINQDCVAAHGTGGPVTDDPAYLCQFAEHTSPFTHTPLFPLQSEYDSWQTSHVLYYPNTAADVQVLGNNLTKRIFANLLGPHPQSGVFLDSCWHHCGKWDGIRIDGDVVSSAFQQWYEGLGVTPRRGARSSTKRVWQQGESYKCDSCCSA